MAERQLPVLDAQHEHTAGLLVVGAVNADVKKSVVTCAPRRNYCKSSVSTIERARNTKVSLIDYVVYHAVPVCGIA